MNICIYSGSTNAVGALALMDAGRRFGHAMSLISGLSIDEPMRAALLKADIFISRFSKRNYQFAAEVTEYCQKNNPACLVAVPAKSIRASFNKYETFLRLQQAGIPTVPTMLITTETKVDVSSFRFPIIAKPVDENRGEGVHLARTSRELEEITVALLAKYQRFIVQPFIAEAGGADNRLFSNGNRVIAAIERQAPRGMFISNIAQGGMVSPIASTLKEQQMAVDASRLFDLQYAGVDILHTSKGPVILEVNASPGFKAGVFCGVDLPDYIIANLANIKDRHND